MPSDINDDKLLRIIKKTKAEEAQRLSRCKRVEAILLSRVQKLESLKVRLAEEVNELESLENKLSISVFVEGNAGGFECISRRRLNIRERISKIESDIGESDKEVTKAHEHLATARAELQAVMSSRKTAEQMCEKRRIARHLLAEQEEENLLDDVRSKGMEELLRSRLRK